MEVAIVKAFTHENQGGNGAGIVVLNEQISDDRKQEIANKVGLSETAFIFKQDENDYNLSFFTPVCEVDLCGHATIAAFYYLGKMGHVKGFNETRTVYQNTKAGRLKIEITFKNHDVEYVLMQQSRPQIYGELKEIKQIAASLNIDEGSIGLTDYDISPTIVSTGLKDILVPDIHMVPFGFRTFLHSLIHSLLKLCLSSTSFPISHSALFTDTIFPPLQVMPLLLRK
jgi:PhzF family phenazine biosynthesis protein